MTRLRPAGNYVPVLVVLPTDVMNAADGGPVSERAVRPVPVVVVEPVWQRLVALSMCAVDDPVGPLPGHRLVEALDLPVRARSIGLGGRGADPLAGEQLAQRAVLGVGEGVIAHQPPRSDAVALVEGECSLEEAGHGRCPLVAMELDIGEARVVVDDRVRKSTHSQRLVGYDFAHAIVDDHSRLAYVELHRDERAATVTGFLERALAFYQRHGIRARRLMSDNAFAYTKNRSLCELLAREGIRHLTTEPYRPRTNGKVERFHQTMAREWAYGVVYRSHRERNQALPHWLDHYNTRRPHSSLGDRPPISRVHNVRG